MTTLYAVRQLDVMAPNLHHHMNSPYDCPVIIVEPGQPYKMGGTKGQILA